MELPKKQKIYIHEKVLKLRKAGKYVEADALFREHFGPVKNVPKPKTRRRIR